MGTDESRDLRDLRTSCRNRLNALFAQLRLDRLASVEELCAFLTEQRKRPVLLEAIPLPPTIAGAWLANERADYIFYARDAPRPHQEHIILHEVAHLLCEHESLPGQIELLQALLFPHLDQTIVRAALGRTRYDTRQEREAEVMATMMEQRWLRRRRRRSAVVLDKSDEERDAAERLDVFARNLRAW